MRLRSFLAGVVRVGRRPHLHGMRQYRCMGYITTMLHQTCCLNLKIPLLMKKVDALLDVLLKDEIQKAVGPLPDPTAWWEMKSISLLIHVRYKLDMNLPQALSLLIIWFDMLADHGVRIWSQPILLRMKSRLQLNQVDSLFGLSACQVPLGKSFSSGWPLVDVWEKYTQIMYIKTSLSFPCYPRKSLLKYVYMKHFGPPEENLLSFVRVFEASCANALHTKH